jgi:Cu/Ag efflux protein CusF
MPVCILRVSDLDGSWTKVAWRAAPRFSMVPPVERPLRARQPEDVMRKLLFSFVLVAISAVASAQAPTPAPATTMPGFGKTLASVGDAVGITEGATITAIDPTAHTVTLQGPRSKVTYKVSPKFNIKKVKVGDVVVVSAVDAVAVSLKGPQSGPAGATDTAVAVADRTDFGVVDTVRVSAKIKSIDTKHPSVTLIGPAGGTIVVNAKSPATLQGFKVGDDLDVTFTQATVVDLLPPAK